MNDRQIIDALIAHDEHVTRRFFFKDCRPLFVSIIRKVCPYEVNYDEFVNEFYLYLMENDAYRLRQFQGRSSIYQWLKVVAIRYFIARRDRLIDCASEEYLLDTKAGDEVVEDVCHVSADMDIKTLLANIPNRRYAYVIERLVLDDAEPKKVAMELLVSVDNLYNIKKRALASLASVAIKDVEKYGNKNKK